MILLIYAYGVNFFLLPGDFLLVICVSKFGAVLRVPLFSAWASKANTYHLSPHLIYKWRASSIWKRKANSTEMPLASKIGYTSFHIIKFLWVLAFISVQLLVLSALNPINLFLPSTPRTLDPLKPFIIIFICFFCRREYLQYSAAATADPTTPGVLQRYR